MSLWAKLFGKGGKKVVTEVVQAVENKGDTFIKEATTVVKSEAQPTFNSIKGLREQLEKIGLGIRECIEQRPGFRKYKLSDGTELTVNSETIRGFMCGSPNSSSSTLTISRDITDPHFWDFYRYKKDTGEFVPEFLGARRDYMWGKDGLTKATSVQTTYLSQPEHIGRTQYTAVDIGNIPALPKVQTKTSITTKPSNYKYKNSTLDLPRTEYYGDFGRRTTTDREAILDTHRAGKPLYTGTQYYNRYNWMHNPNIGRFGEM